MNIREISDVFKDTASNITAIKSYNFGWASDRVRHGNTEDYQDLNEFPRIFFSVPTIIGSDQTRKQDTYQVTLFFDDLLGYDNEGDADLTLQIDKWASLQQYANYFIQRLNLIKQTILPNYLFIPEAPSITFDSFTGIQRMVTVQLTFNLVVPTNCDIALTKLVECIANITTSTQLEASLTTVLKFAANLEARATLTADINFVHKVASSLNANALLVSDINFVQKAQASLLTSAIVSGDITIPKIFNASLLATGTTTADLTVTAAASLLLDLYPNAAAAYSLRKLRTAYTGSAIRVRRSSDNTEQDIGFVADQLDTVSLLSFCGAGNGFVTTWYDQSGNANNATQTTQANQPQVVSFGTLITQNAKATLKYDGSNDYLDAIGVTAGNPKSIFVVTKSNYIGLFEKVLFDSITTNQATLYKSSADLISLGFGLFIATTYTATLNFILYSVMHNGANSNAFVNSNNQILVNQNLGTNAFNGLRIAGSRGTASLFYDGNISEFIIYSSNQSTNRSGIETNINTNYAIY